MKLIKAIINPHKLSEIREALSELSDYGLTVNDVKGYGRQKGHKEVYRGNEYEINFVPKVMIELVVADESVEEIVTCITENARSGKVGDGKIFVSEIEQAIRIRTSDSGDSAL